MVQEMAGAEEVEGHRWALPSIAVVWRVWRYWEWHRGLELRRGCIPLWGLFGAISGVALPRLSSCLPEAPVPLEIV